MRSEFDLIAALVERLPPRADGIRVPSGDDAAVVEARGRATATTVDAVVEGVHFTPAFPRRAVGRKALAAALSDLAAMGAEPGEAYVALGVPEGVEDADLLELADGLAEVAGREGVSVAGGDVTRAPALTLAVTCVGLEPPGGRLVSRGGASVGEVVVVTGELGGAAAALLALEAGSSEESELAPQFDPRPRLEAGRALAAAGVTAMIDVSDGAGADAVHIAAASGVRIEIEAARLPVAAAARERSSGAEAAIALAISGGEDYELLATLSPDRLEAASEALGPGTQLSEVGRVMEGEGVTVLAADGRELEPGGFDHMRGSRSG